MSKPSHSLSQETFNKTMRARLVETSNALPKRAATISNRVRSCVREGCGRATTSLQHQPGADSGLSTAGSRVGQSEYQPVYERSWQRVATTRARSCSTARPGPAVSDEQRRIVSGAHSERQPSLEGETRFVGLCRMKKQSCLGEVSRAREESTSAVSRPPSRRSACSTSSCSSREVVQRVCFTRTHG